MCKMPFYTRPEVCPTSSYIEIPPTESTLYWKNLTPPYSVRTDVQAQVQQQPPGAQVQGAQVQGALPGPSPAQQQSGPPPGGQVGHTYK
jgi:hypothetical protein